jgi:Trypsin-like serine proteases, typically periplasmic, contain C-terminal PDZ domain
MRRDLVLTAKHVLDEAVEEERPIFLVNGSDEGRLTCASLRKLYSHPEIDLALVQVALEDLRIDHPLFPAHFPLNQGQGAIAFGYNRSMSNNATNTWVFSAHEVKAFTPQKRERYFGSIEFVLEFDAPWIEPGFSGGPVITIGGGVVAVLTEGAIRNGALQSVGRATSVYPMVESFRSPFELPK